MIRYQLSQTKPKITQREKCPYSKFFLSLCSRIRTSRIRIVFIPNAKKYGPEKLRIRTLSRQCYSYIFFLESQETTNSQKYFILLLNGSSCLLKIGTRKAKISHKMAVLAFSGNLSIRLSWHEVRESWFVKSPVCLIW